MTIAPNTSAGGRAVIMTNVRKEHEKLLGMPAMDRRVFAKASVVFKHLPDILAVLGALL